MKELTDKLAPQSSIEGLVDATRQIKRAADAKKCWSCFCMHSSLKAIQRAFPEDKRPAKLAVEMSVAQQRLTKVQYECLGCEVCFPAIALNALKVEEDICPEDLPKQRPGWPPLPGSYRVLRYRAPVALTTLMDDALCERIASKAGPEIVMVGTLQTENLGIERVIQNVVANPNIRFLIVCGADSWQKIGHLPGQSLVSLARSGLDSNSRIIGAWGKRPCLRNISSDLVEHFRRTVKVVDLVGNNEIHTIFDTVANCAQKNVGPAEPYVSAQTIAPLRGYLPQRMSPDPAGYFVIYVNRPMKTLSLEHYQNDGILDQIIEGKTAAELLVPAIERELVSRLDHAAYLGRELARAEYALSTGEPYVQDAAPEQNYQPDQSSLLSADRM